MFLTPIIKFKIKVCNNFRMLSFKCLCLLLLCACTVLFPRSLFQSSFLIPADVSSDRSSGNISIFCSKLLIVYIRTSSYSTKSSSWSTRKKIYGRENSEKYVKDLVLPHSQINIVDSQCVSRSNHPNYVPSISPINLPVLLQYSPTPPHYSLSPDDKNLNLIYVKYVNYSQIYSDLGKYDKYEQVSSNMSLGHMSSSTRIYT